MDLRIELNVTNALIAFNISLFVVTGLIQYGLLLNGESSHLEALDILGASAYYYTLNFEFWRFVNATFLHANVFHLVMNMYALNAFGGYLERQFDGKKLFSVYVLSGIGGSILSVLVGLFFVAVGAYGENEIRLSVGASGAIFGIMGYLLVAPSIGLDKTRLIYVLLLNVIIGLAFWHIIDNPAHLGGFLTGCLLSFIDNRIKFDFYHKFNKPLFILALVFFIISYVALLLHNIFQIL